MYIGKCSVCGARKLLHWIGGDQFEIVCKCGVCYSKLVPISKNDLEGIALLKKD